MSNCHDQHAETIPRRILAQILYDTDPEMVDLMKVLKLHDYIEAGLNAARFEAATQERSTIWLDEIAGILRREQISLAAKIKKSGKSLIASTQKPLSKVTCVTSHISTQIVTLFFICSLWEILIFDLISIR